MDRRPSWYERIYMIGSLKDGDCESYFMNKKICTL